jgi:hypothetical protein
MIDGHSICWLIQKRTEKRAYKKRSKARETESMSLVTCTAMVLEIDRRDLPNRVTISFTPVRNDDDCIRYISARRVTKGDLEPGRLQRAGLLHGGRGVPRQGIRIALHEHL